MQKTLQDILDFINEGVVYQEANGKIKIWNKAAEKIFGLSAEQAVGLTSVNHPWNLINADGTHCPGEDHPSMITLTTGRALKDQIRGIKSQDGSVTWLSINTIPVFKQDDSKPSAVVISFQDVTKKVRSDQALLEEKKRYAAAARMAKLGHWIRDFSSDQAEWSPEMFSIFGRAPALGAPNQKEFFEEYIHPEDRDKLRENVQASLNSSEPFSFEYRIIRPDGQIRYIQSMGEAMGSGENEDSHLIGFLQDITKRKLLEQKLKSSKALLDNVYASLEEAVFVVDPETRYVISCNDAAEKMFGYSRDEMIGRNTRFLHVSNQKYQEFGKILNDSLDSNGVFHLEFKLRRKDGTHFHSDHTIKEVKDDNERLVIRVSVVRDISEHRKTLEELKKKSKELSTKALNLEELNIALKVMLEHRDREKMDLEESFASSINSLILPYLDRIRKTKLNALQMEYLAILENGLKEIVRPYIHRMSDQLMLLSPSETRVANYVKQGWDNKKIADMLNVSLRTVEFHRQNIRNKLGIKNRKINLRTYLSDIS
jgi:PAS domain S-box-containing protein